MSQMIASLWLISAVSLDSILLMFCLDMTDDGKDLMEVTFDVEGMVCMSCIKSIEAALNDKPGIVTGKASLERNQAWVRFDSRTVGTEEIRLLIEECGFDVIVSGESSVL